jgi:glycosyltransferase involved in cell wall biosynthesis
MKILALAWEFPPRLVGGIARHVSELYPELVQLGHEVHLITVEFGQAPAYEQVDGIHVYRVCVDESRDFFHWVANMNISMGSKAAELLRSVGSFDLIHAHDWLVGDAAISLKHHFKLPLIATIHATEYGRHNGIHTDTQRYVYQKERDLCYNAWRIIVCTNYMRQEVARTLNNPWDKIDVIYNGIRPEKKCLPPGFDVQKFRRRFANDEEKIVYYVGRMSPEKGVSVLLDAAPTIIQHLSGQVKIVLIGGGNTDRLKQQAAARGISSYCLFTGFMPDDELNYFQVVADCAVFPSLYEPFGIVALESFAARVPVVVSDTGGLPEVVSHGRTGIITRANDPQSLAWGVLEVLKSQDYARWLSENAYVELEHRFSWSKLAVQTEAVYLRVVAERSLVEW